MQVKLTIYMAIMGFWILGLTGCTTSGNAIPDGPTMADVYAEAMHQSNGETLEAARSKVPAVSAPVVNSDINLSTYTRTSANEIDQLFPTLPNPELVMYVYPHLAGSEQTPVPGYSTAFSLYEKTVYAMPGDMLVNSTTTAE